MLTIGIWFCGLATSACAIAVVLFMRQNRQIITTLEAQLEGLGETHLMGIEALTLDLDRLKARVAELER